MGIGEVAMATTVVDYSKAAYKLFYHGNSDDKVYRRFECVFMAVAVL